MLEIKLVEMAESHYYEITADGYDAGTLHPNYGVWEYWLPMDGYYTSLTVAQLQQIIDKLNELNS